ncbi:hypothetical protein Q4Q57_14975 [Shewanella sp. SP2S2-6]|uniref:hypothetical protein n=1 Tax=Shewanella sp. SP2S2-6 TaxID=3063540 RepID=UPI00288F3FF7|nr:hypothetical protein [Shewanella sp. SP2S2-6]MDT3296445.1 hypothetical protein [Shewanella sp. SP2S2-6]
MWNKIINATGSLHLYLIAALIIVITLLGLSLTAVKADLALKNSQIETAAVNQRMLQDDLTVVTDELQAQAIERDRLAKDYAFALALNEQTAKAKAEIDRQLADQRDAIKKLRTSANEQTRSWANTAVPDDVKRLLKHAAYCAHRSHQADPICVTAAIINEPVPASRM